jgi:hypothetical protein
MNDWSYTELAKLWLAIIKRNLVTEARRIESELDRREKGMR